MEDSDSQSSPSRWMLFGAFPMNSSSLRHLFTRILLPGPPERPLHAIDRRLAKEWIKKRLAGLYPELRGDPEALEAAYLELGLEPAGTVRRPDGDVKSYAMNLPASIRDAFARR
jgi:hypothetical protein